MAFHGTLLMKLVSYHHNWFLFLQQALVDVWKVRSLVPFPPQRGRLMKKMRYIYTSDWLMKLEGGVNTISAEALAEVQKRPS